MIQPLTRNSVCELTSLPQHAGEIPTSQSKLEDVQVADFASWLDDHLNALEFTFREFWTNNSKLDAVFSGRHRR
jgi:hypothetical protein